MLRVVREGETALTAEVNADIKKAEKTAKVMGKHVAMLIDSYIGMLIAGGLHGQPHMHTVPAVSYFGALGIRYLAHIVFHRA